MHVEGAARWALERLDEMFSPDVAAVVLLDPTTRSWHVAAGTGVRTGTPESPVGAPPRAVRGGPRDRPRRARGPRTRVSATARAGACTAPCTPATRSSACWRSRAATGSPRGPTERRRIGDLARAAALAIDNARWLERIHTLGMEQERTRLARELHDHIGQSVVYLGFEIDRLVELNHGRAVQADLLRPAR